MSPGREATVEVDGHRLVLTNLDKVLYPAVGFTKGDLLAYYSAIAPTILGHLAVAWRDEGVGDVSVAVVHAAALGALAVVVNIARAFEEPRAKA